MGARFMSKFKVFALIVALCLSEVQAMAADGLITVRSSYGPEETMNRLETEVGEGLDRICPDRSCSGSRTGRTAAAADCALDLWQCQRWHAAHAIGSDDRNRFTTKGASLARRIRSYMAFIQ